MIQTIAFNSSTDIDINDAIFTAKISFPNEDFSAVKTAIDLEQYFNNIGQTLFVQVDTDKQTNAAIKEESELKTQVDKDVANFKCHLPPATFTSDDLNTDLCEDLPEFPDDLSPTEKQKIDVELSELEKTLADIGVEAQGKIDDVLSCVASMTSITNDIKLLNIKENNIKNTLVNLEEFLYNYRIMEAYFKKRVQTVDQILGVFDPLITQERDYEAQIALITPLDTQSKTDLDAAVARLNAQNGVSGVSGTTPNNSTSTTVETQSHVDQLQSAYNAVHAQLVAAKANLQTVKDNITFKENQISPFLQEINFEKTTTFQNKNTQEKEQAKLAWLKDNIQNLFNGGSTAFGQVAAFSTRSILVPNAGSSTPNQSFLLTIMHDMKDDSNILAGRPKTYSTAGTNIIIEPNNGVPHGTLYDQLYNIWGDVELFFTRAERGLTSDSNLVSAQLKGTGTGSFGSNFIQDFGLFQDFYENFPARHADKVTLVKGTVIEPALQQVIAGLEDLALKEVEYLFAYGKAFETLPAESSKLTDIISAIRLSSQIYIARILELRTDYAFVQQAHKDVLDAIEAKKQEYQQTPCAKQQKSMIEKDPATAGSDPLGANTMQDIFPEDPDPTKFCYWVKFSALATAVNMLPISGAGGFRYWPVGLIIPTPAGATINIPLPIIWIPIAVIVLPVGLFVIFIGQCGICPSPFVLFIGPDGEKKFIVSLRPTDDFGANASVGIIKALEFGGLAINTKINDMLNKVSIPTFNPIMHADASSAVLDDVKDKILKMVNKIGTPDITPITSRLTTGSTVQDKKNMLKDVVTNHMNKLTLPTIKIPKDSAKTNPKPLPITEVLNDLTKLLSMKLPQIAIPTVGTIDLNQKLIDQVHKIKIPDLPSISIPPVNYDTATEAELNAHANKVKTALKSGIQIAHINITPRALGIMTTVLGSGIVFINPYKCKPGSKGIGVPPISPLALIALGALKVAADAYIDGLTIPQIKNMLLGLGGFLTSAFLPSILAGILKGLPPLTIPDPSNISIKDMLKASALSLSKMQLPSLPDITKPIQIQIPIPGEALKVAVVTAVLQALDNLPITDIDFTRMTGIDAKQLIITMVETSFAAIAIFLAPILLVISAYQISKNKSFSEILGLKKITKDDTVIQVVPKAAMDAAIAALKVMALVPFPAVAFAPEAFKHLHPILSSDDLPPWKRLTLENFLFVIFIDQFCSTAKIGGGIQENP